MSARLLKNGPQSATAYAPFHLPVTGQARDGEDQRGTERIVSGVLEEARQQAQQILQRAQAEAAQLLAEAQHRVVQIEQEAQERGLSQARGQIEALVETGVTDLREQLAQTVSELAEVYPLIAHRAEQDLVRLALEIARKVVHREVTTDPDISMTLARVALERLHPRALATIRFHPEDFAYVTAHREKLASGSALEIVADTSVGRGGCIVTSEHGDIDARIDQQFALLERGFFER